ncbi:helix-turn-helix transcriptional regulator [Phragmitibacter flavus]|uniref:helix-turn-helix transcriptional regulator n=1 Tax=Phragmitibacter flavus TaxID=2576071 RepID=UPI0014079BAE|nr:AraC family transcriptional regulator [Phragmitibacter flavus]
MSPLFFLVELVQPILVRGQVVAELCLEPLRVSDEEFASFDDCARVLLDDGLSAVEMRQAHQIFHEILAVPRAEVQALETMLRLFSTQLSEFAERMFLNETESEPPSVRKARVYILNRLSEPLSLEEVATAAGLSAFHFCKVFKRTTGMTFTEFVNHARIEQAKRLLMKPHSRITEIAYDVGFQSLSQFNRSFRRVARVSPTEFRQHAVRTGNGERPALAS